ncbi:MAG: IspD/TarI family cytidylyltransferase [Spirochaetota bacterium]
MNFIYGILLSGGSGTRFASNSPKQFTDLCGKPILVHAALAFKKWGLLKTLVVVAHPDHLLQTEEILADCLDGSDKIVAGGKTRHESTLNGIAATNAGSNDVLVFHDGARPFVTSTEFDLVVHAAIRSGAASTAAKATDTLVVASKRETCESFLQRDSVRLIKTPQALHTSVLTELKDKMLEEEPTDLCSWVQVIDLQAELVSANPYNLKVTVAEDLKIATSYYSYFQEDN